MKKRRGFTLLEVVTATLIITAMAGGMFGAFVGARYFFRSARHKMQAYNFAREVQDKLRANYTYDDPQMSVGSHSASETGIVVVGEMASLNHTLTYDVSQPETGYRKVKVRVWWEENKFF